MQYSGKQKAKMQCDKQAKKKHRCNATSRQTKGIDAKRQAGKIAVQCACRDNTRPGPESEEAEKGLSGGRK